MQFGKNLARFEYKYTTTAWVLRTKKRIFSSQETIHRITFSRKIPAVNTI